jgi:pimeloyl-ACP methyl ester carboxylesterase
MRAVLIDDPERLRDERASWAALVARSDESELGVHPDWVLPWWETFGSTGARSLRVLALFEGPEMVGLAPLVARPHRYRPGIPFRRLEALASGEDEADEICTDYLGVVASTGREAEVARAVTEALGSGGLGAWDELVLPALRGDRPLPDLLRRAAEERGLLATLAPQGAAPFISLPATWEAYLAQLKPQKRSQLKKALKKLESWGGEVALHRVKTHAELAEGKRVLESLHRQRWGGEGVYRSARYRAFHDRVMPALLDRGALELGWLCARGEPVAAFYNIAWNGRVLHYQSGRRTDVPDDVRVGVTMHALLVQDAIARGMREYDFLAGVSQYKTALSHETRPLVTLRLARPSAVEAARRATVFAKASAETLRAKLLARANPEEGEVATMARSSEESRGAKGRVLGEDVRACVFGPEARALFGVYHPPARGASSRAAIVLCAPLGYEAICAYPALRVFAEQLAAAGHPVLRFDYDGCGDSAGTDRDPGRIPAWIASVGHAIDEVRALGGVSVVRVVGVRMGATLAAAAAMGRTDVDAVALWNPCVSGRHYAREMKMFRQFAEQSGELRARPKAEGDASEESGGFLLTAETLEGLKKLDVAKLSERVAPRILVLGRDDVPDDDKLARALGDKGAAVAYERLPGYAAMMVAPHKSAVPGEVFARIASFLALPASEVLASPARATVRESGTVAFGVRETPRRFGAGGRLVGVLTEPVSTAIGGERPLVVFTNTAGNHRIGPNRMWAEIARKLGAIGFSSVRFDVSGVGDSVVWDAEAENHPYSGRLARDVRDVVDALANEGRAKRFGVAGLCSGAFVGWHAAASDPRIESLVLVNLQIFAWEEGMSLDVNPLETKNASEYYKKRLFAKEAWMKLLRGGVNPRHALAAVRGRAADLSRSAIARAKARLPASLAPASDVARVAEAMCARGADIFFVFSSEDPGIQNLDENLGPRRKLVERAGRFTTVTINGPDHSFTPLWAQEELEKAIVGHLTTRFGARESSALGG